MEESLPPGPVENIPAPLPEIPEPAESDRQKVPIGIIIAVVALLLLLIAGVVFLLRASGETVAQIRDVFIIFLALESFVIGIALVILIVQLATLINLLNNEIRPIIRSTNDTVNTIRGTMTFLSENLSEPVIRLNETIAALSKFFEIIRPRKR
jgi:hypothetical protein